MFWFVFLFPGKPGYLLSRETPPSRTGVGGCRGAGAQPSRGGAGGAAGPSPPWPAEMALLSVAAARQGRGSAA